MGPAVWAEIRWAFTPPRTWLMGVLANVVFAAGWLVVQPLATGHGHHHDMAVLVGTYFSSWVLADVTTTNLFGTDHYRVRQALANGVPFSRILVIKNLALLVLVGLPTLLTAMVLTLWLETPERLAITVPTVAVPIVSWLGVGNLISVVHPVGVEPLIGAGGSGTTGTAPAAGCWPSRCRTRCTTLPTRWTGWSTACSGRSCRP